MTNIPTNSDPTRQCRCCHVVKPATPEFFWRFKRGFNGVDTRCKDCMNTGNKDWKADHRLAKRRASLWSRLNERALEKRTEVTK